MLYLIRSYGKDNSILKVGYASNMEKRLLNYTSHNPLIDILSTREGELLEETALHLYLHFLGYGCIMNEWYEDKEEIINIFNNFNINSLPKEMWENRNVIFSSFDVDKFTTAIQVYELLLDQYGKDLIPVNTVDDKGILIKSNGYELDSRYYKRIGFINQIKNLNLGSEPKEIKTFIYEFNNCKNFIKKMKLLCKFIKNYENLYKLKRDLLEQYVPKEYFTYIDVFGPDKIRACSYKRERLENEYNRQYNNQNINIEDRLYSEFKVGERYLMSDIKERLRETYNQVGYNKTPKATDLSSYFEIKKANLKIGDKRVQGFEILAKK